MLRLMLKSLFLLLPITTFAFNCPTVNNTIEPGASYEQVEAICGAPAGQHALKTRAVPVMELMYRTRTGQVKVVLENNELTAIQPA
jgi:hypothetical protein